MTCEEWFHANFRLANAGVWERVMPFDCMMEACGECKLYMERMMYYFLTNNEVTPPMDDVIRSIYGRFRGERWLSSAWMKKLNTYRTSLPVLRYLLENEYILLDESEPTTLIAVFIDSYNSERERIIPDTYCPEHIDYLTSSEVNVSVNLPDSSGNTPLMSFIQMYTDVFCNAENEDEEERVEMLLHIEYFLEKGADPLLTNKYDMSSLSYVERELDWGRRSGRINMEKLEELLELLTCYI